MGPSVHKGKSSKLAKHLLCGLCCLSHERILEMYLSYLQYLVSAQSVFTFLIFRHSLSYPALTKPRPLCTYASPLAPNPIAATSRVLEENLNNLSELEVSLCLKVRWYKQIASRMPILDLQFYLEIHPDTTTKKHTRS